MLKVSVWDGSALRICTDLFVLPLHSDILPIKGFVGELDWQLNGLFSRLYRFKKFRGTVDERALMPGDDRFHWQKILLIGLGAVKWLSPATIAKAYEALPSIALNLRIRNMAALGWSPLAARYDQTAFATSLMEGMCNSLRDFSSGLALSKFTLVVPAGMKGEVFSSIRAAVGGNEGSIKLKLMGS